MTEDEFVDTKKGVSQKMKKRASFYCQKCKIHYSTILKRNGLVNRSADGEYELEVGRTKAKCPCCADEVEQEWIV